MLPWLRRPRERVERIEAEAEELVRLLGGDAYGEARWHEQTASSRAMAQAWNLIAMAIERQTGRRIGLDVSTQMAMNTVFAPDRDQRSVSRDLS
jgi:tagatose-1,6-bisphosphate aldolase non-catalytic subunit AgaZ/GatZ